MLKVIITTDKSKGIMIMKKAILIISFAVLLLAVIVGGLSLYIVNIPERALNNIIEDVDVSSIVGRRYRIDTQEE